MKYPCEVVVRYFLPAYRSLIAKKMIEDYGLTQVAAAKKLGTTQAAISYYLSSKRGEKYIRQLESNPQIRSTIDEIAKKLAAGTISSAEATLKLCDLCVALRDSNLISGMQKDDDSLPDSG